VRWKDYVNKNSNYTIGNRSRDLPVCSAVSQPMRHRVPPEVSMKNVLYKGECCLDSLDIIVEKLYEHYTTTGLKSIIVVVKFCQPFATNWE
jgi:hypothetical protein